MKKRVTPEALADMLMKRVYVPFSAAAQPTRASVFSSSGRIPAVWRLKSSGRRDILKRLQKEGAHKQQNMGGGAPQARRQTVDKKLFSPRRGENSPFRK